MRIILIEPSDTIVKIGLRQVSSYLKSHGHTVSILFIPQFDLLLEAGKLTGCLKNFISGADLIGLSVTSCCFVQSVEITRMIKKLSEIPVIWGGIHATACPEDSLKYADMVCIGEGEDSLLELVTKMESGNSIFDTKGIWFNKKNEIIKNKVRPLEMDLDKYPFLDYKVQDHFVFSGAEIKEMDDDSFKYYIGLRSIRDYSNAPLYTYYTIWSRGCPHSCTYCCNNLFENIYGIQGKKVRRRSVHCLIEELKEIKERFPYISFMNFFDDEFLATGIDTIKQFCEMYKNEIRLPFKCNFSPTTITEEKLHYLTEAGLAQIEMGIESGSNRVNKEIYKRNVKNESVIKASKIINQYRKIIRPRYDIILDNPYENDNDLVKTIKLLSVLPKPFRIGTFSLTFFPGTELYFNAKKDGKIKDEIKDIYLKKNNALSLENISYLKLILVASPFLPRFVVSVLISKIMIRIFNRDLWKKLFINTILIARKAGQYYKFNSDVIKTKCA